MACVLYKMVSLMSYVKYSILYRLFLSRFLIITIPHFIRQILREKRWIPDKKYFVDPCPRGTLSFYDIYILSLILDCVAKINDRLLHPFCNLSLLICSSFFISIVWKPLCLKCFLEAGPYFSNAPVSRDILLVSCDMEELNIIHIKGIQS